MRRHAASIEVRHPEARAQVRFSNFCERLQQRLFLRRDAAVESVRLTAALGYEIEYRLGLPFRQFSKDCQKMIDLP